MERRAAPCHETCPANIDIPSFIAHLGHGDYRSTIEVIRRDNVGDMRCINNHKDLQFSATEHGTEEEDKTASAE